VSYRFDFYDTYFKNSATKSQALNVANFIILSIQDIAVMF